MAKKAPNKTAEALREMEATGDRLSTWAADNAALILGALAGVLVIAAGVGLWSQHRTGARDAAADALALATVEYRTGMGADVAGGAVPEPANPEVAERVRRESAERFEAVGREHGGSMAGAIAWLEAGNLQLELEQLEKAAANFSAARRQAAGTPVAALAITRLAGLAEDRGDMAAAAEAYEEAAAIKAYPLRAEALAEAARCWAAAGNAERALAVVQTFETRFPDAQLPPVVRARVEELRLKRAS